MFYLIMILSILDYDERWMTIICELWAGKDVEWRCLSLIYTILFQHYSEDVEESRLKTLEKIATCEIVTSWIGYANKSTMTVDLVV